MNGIKLNSWTEELDGKWRGVIEVPSPDGKIFKLSKGFIFASKEEAEMNINATLAGLEDLE